MHSKKAPASATGRKELRAYQGDAGSLTPSADRRVVRAVSMASAQPVYWCICGWRRCAGRRRER
eukprot:7937668-Alexandrium_andersonii.AAC.1